MTRWASVRCVKSRRVATNGASGRLGVRQGGAIMRAAHAEHKDDACYRRGGHRRPC